MYFPRVHHQNWCHGHGHHEMLQNTIGALLAGEKCPQPQGQIHMHWQHLHQEQMCYATLAMALASGCDPPLVQAHYTMEGAVAHGRRACTGIRHCFKIYLLHHLLGQWLMHYCICRPSMGIKSLAGIKALKLHNMLSCHPCTFQQCTIRIGAIRSIHGNGGWP